MRIPMVLRRQSERAMRSEYNSPPSRERLVQRLRQLGQEVQDDASPEQLAHVINQCLCDQAIATRAIVDGKPKALTFAALWSAVFQQKWVYVRQEERTRPISEMKL